jgi:hypothetical protein
MTQQVYIQEDLNCYLDTEGVKYPRVSNILPKQDFSNIPVSVLENARIEGQANHMLLKMFHSNCARHVFQDRFTNPLLDSYVKYIKDFYDDGWRPFLYEHALYHPKLLYAGTPDVVWKRDREFFIVDCKRTIGNPKLVGLQISAYVLMVRKLYPNLIDQRAYHFAFEEKNGQLIRRHCVDRFSEKIFLQCLDVYKAKENIENYLQNN